VIGDAKKEQAPAAKAGEAPKKKWARSSAELFEARAHRAYSSLMPDSAINLP
jgi:hypothetical protein